MIKGIDNMLTLQDVAALIGKPIRFVRERLVNTGVLKAKRITSRDYRIRPQDFAAWQVPK